MGTSRPHQGRASSWAQRGPTEVSDQVTDVAGAPGRMANQTEATLGRPRGKKMLTTGRLGTP